MRPMTEAEFQSRLGMRPSLHTLAETIGDFLASHGFFDASRRAQEELLDRPVFDDFYDGEPDDGGVYYTPAAAAWAERYVP